MQAEKVDGQGRLVTWTSIRRPPAGREDLGAYKVAVVALDAGVQVTGRLAPDAADFPVNARVACVALQDDVPIFNGAADG